VTQPDHLTQPDDQLYQDLRQVLNRHSAENGSNTPDFVLAEYLQGCLQAFDYAVRTRASATQLSPLDPNPGSTLFARLNRDEQPPAVLPGVQTVLEQHARAVEELLRKATCAVCGDPAVTLVQAKPARFSANRDLDDALTLKILEEVLPLCAAHPDVRAPGASSDPYLWESGT
jgi:hypothetical protein